MLKDNFLAHRKHGFKQRTQIGEQMNLYSGINAFIGKMQSYWGVFTYVKTHANDPAQNDFESTANPSTCDYGCLSENEVWKSLTLNQGCELTKYCNACVLIEVLRTSVSRRNSAKL